MDKDIVPNPKNDLEPFSHGSGQNILSGVATRRRVCTNEGCDTLQGVKVLFVIRLGFAAPIRVVEAQCET